MLPSPLLYLTFYTSTQLTTSLSIQEVKGQPMGKSRHLAFSGQVNMSEFCGSLKWALESIALHRRDHYGSESTSVCIESYEMAMKWVSGHCTAHCAGGVWKACRPDT